MLGSLSRWLRILGFDTLYYKSIDDNELIRIAKQQQRIILTRDTGIAKRKGIDNFILITSNDTLEQLKDVLRKSNLKCGAPRCAECNGELEAAEREAVADSIPKHVFIHSNSFFRCRDCGKVYWEGSHKKSIDARIKEILKGSDTNWKA